MIDTKQRAKDILEVYANYYSQVDLEQIAKILDQIKSEARREFAEKIHKHCTSVELNEYIDTLVEEMERGT